MARKRNIAGIVIFALLAGAMLTAAMQIPQLGGGLIYEGESPYQTVFVTESLGIRRLHAGSLRHNSSAMDVNTPLRHVFEYTALMMLSLGYVDAPESFLVVGLGGGTMTRYLRECYPDARIVSVEFDPEVVHVAKEYFGLEPDDGMEIVEQDARRWLRSTKETFDVIFLDAYHGGYIPFHLTTREFLQMVKDHLNPGGVVCSNTWTSSDLAERESATYQEVFGNFHNFIGKKSRNRVIVAAPRTLPDRETVLRRLGALQKQLSPPYMNMQALFKRHWSEVPPWPKQTKALTDDHAPVNLLLEQD